ncbi:MAG: CsgG/HfaB family protein [Candidatus Cloacimonetes bacterium]|nr:CsgG/HfaB family protein [Candidatus Cloacimonadota bacterium]MCF7813114.1 CsgG/HfaB family protein [Candidatus Cloacimonadota bacterium]MCF7867562.1 CsgG/HfaB family protein [Candidatus Cloacimonadota bacterium]MCF7883044.1 CsgG/HfaB family protein [Candidatus Cloacimonadota bacterium]
MKIFKFILLLSLVLFIVSCGPDYKPKEVRKENVPTLDKQLNNLTSQIIASFNQSNVSKIAVIEFADLEGNVTQLGRFIAEELITRIFTTGRFDVVERNLLQKVLEEQKLGMTGYIDQETAISLGQILGVDAIISGSISDLGKNVKINARLISTESGSVFAVASVNVQKDDTIKLLLGESIQQTFETNDNSISEPQLSGIKPPVVEHGIQFVLKECFYTNGIVSVILDVTNLDMDKNISLLDRKDQYYIRIIDDQGREFKSREQFLGTHSKGWNGIRDVMLVQDVATQYTVKFSGVKTKPEMVKRLDLLLEIPDIQNYFSITFRDIPVQ